MDIIAAYMSYLATTDPKFIGVLERWFQTQPEILVLIRYAYAAGSIGFEFFASLQELSDRMRQLPPHTCVIAFKQPQLPLRGVVDDSFIAHCLSNIPDGAEYLMVEMARRAYGRMSWFPHGAGESHAELREHLQDSHGIKVGVGLYPPWFTDTDEVISAVVPDGDGAVKLGVY